MSVVLIRHTTVDAAGLCYGHCDVPLAATFAEDASAVCERLGWSPPVVYSSPAERCLRLARALGAGDIRVDARLRELHFGRWEGRRWDDIPRAEVDAWGRQYVDTPPPGGESLRDLAARVQSFRESLNGQDAVIVTHGGVIRTWLCLAEHRPLSTAFDRPIAYGECVHVS